MEFTADSEETHMKKPSLLATQYPSLNEEHYPRMVKVPRVTHLHLEPISPTSHNLLEAVFIQGLQGTGPRIRAKNNKNTINMH